MARLNLDSLARTPGRYSCGDGLVLQIRTPAKGSWVWKFQRGGRRREMGFGPWPAVPISLARERMFAAKKLLAEGRDPLAERDAGTVDASFAAMAAAYIEAHKASWKAKADQAWRATLGTYAGPVIGHKNCRDVTTQDVLAILTPLWTSKTATAVKLARRIAAVLDFARVQGVREGENPARWKGLLSFSLPPPGRVHRTTHRAAVPYTELASVMTRLAKAQGTAQLAVRFAAMTAQRATATTHARWADIDRSTATWTVPVEFSKTARPLRVALSSGALAVLDEAAKHRQPNGLVFPGGVQDRPLSLSALVKILRTAGGAAGATTHGLRSAFRTWAGETGENTHYAEHALGHVVEGAVERAYLRTDYLEQRRPLMESWSRYLSRSTKSRSLARVVRGNTG